MFLHFCWRKEGFVKSLEMLELGGVLISSSLGHSGSRAGLQHVTSRLSSHGRRSHRELYRYVYIFRAWLIYIEFFLNTCYLNYMGFFASLIVCGFLPEIPHDVHGFIQLLLSLSFRSCRDVCSALRVDRGSEHLSWFPFQCL